VLAVTVLAAEAMWAEVLAKGALIAGPDLGPELVAACGACGLLIDGAGDLHTIGEFERFVAWAA
jgi:thiamine biosynthesis lipoprotein